MSKLLANFLLLPLLLHPVFQGPFKPKSARSAPIRASFLTSNPAPGPLHLAPGRQVGSSAPPRGTRGRALSPAAPRGAGIRATLPCRPRSFRAPPQHPRAPPTSKLSLSLRPVQPPSCKNQESDSQLPTLAPADPSASLCALRDGGERPGGTAGASAAVCGEGGRGRRQAALAESVQDDLALLPGPGITRAPR